MSKTRFDTFLNEMHAQTPPLPEYDQDKVDEAVLALLYLTLHQPGPYLAWKGVDWGALDRLHVKGLIGDPKNKNADAQGGTRRVHRIRRLCRRGATP